MRKELILLGLLTICGITYTHAVRTERLNLKGGVIVEGHIVSQNLGQSVTFSVERTYATVNSSWVAERTKEVVKSSSLNDGWKTWAEENFGADIKSDITLSRIRIERIGTLNSDNRMEPEDLITAQVLSSLFNNKTHQVYEFEEGAYVRFVDLTTALHTFNLSDIHSIEYKERKDSQINGETEDVAYFTPFYLKDFVAKMPKKLI